ncbi:cellulose biosynthesis cyclic di-GMP-binding regulatory protein BcsB [Microcoleus sp. FACHB-1515]|uniref:cellulose biosynthesis cyclic di-GMP-binding regulatory protein BcsB n=1 Tax=Cyanophyceae TaxID=3028117 RepID=UPI001687E179|nr:cellulose biosynthesis cyclic di-GMP-binding regulatory protein BcsB [Microcoleus sp. FACHB-1515]MBD2091540.1 cellulose biosynthesis cyclic di-GMP-binding regulatory protein BcsB [Microcoleus sp. FACHB-1515]
MKNRFSPSRRWSRRSIKSVLLTGLLLLSCCFVLMGRSVNAQTAPSPAATPAPTIPLPAASATPTVAPAEPGTYVLEFNRSPIVGNRLRLDGIYDEARLAFTRPRNWKPANMQVLLKFRHSPALYASRSNLTVLVNGTSIGSTPMNMPEGQIGSVSYPVPPEIIHDYNEIVVAGLQNNSPTCTQDPFDPSLWTEILPDSKLVFKFEPQAIPLNFSQYPYPIFDKLSLEANRLALMQPQSIDEAWLTAVSRYQASLGRIADYRAMETRLVSTLDQVEENEKLVIIGTPKSQSAIAALKLPIALKDGKFLDAQQKPIPDTAGLLVLTSAEKNKVPVLVATGNSEAGVAKAVQFLVQGRDQQIGTGQAIVVNELTQVASPPAREWPKYLPDRDRFTLADLKNPDGSTPQDVTVWGSHAPAYEVDFRALPDDRFLPGSTMTLRYSYGPQVNPLTSLVEVKIDGVAIGGDRLSSINGGENEELQLSIPPEAVKPSSRMQINFRLDPRERRSCSRVTDQQLWGTIHTDTNFDLKRENVTQLPNLKLMQFGYPFAAPQDLSTTAIVVPDKPTADDLLLLLGVSERLGRLSQADSIQLVVTRSSKLSEDLRKDRNLIAIGTQANFPYPEVFSSDQGFKLGDRSSRQWQQSQIQTLPDPEGLVKQILSPWNRDRVLLALSGQSPAGLKQVRQLISDDPLFSQLQGDTVLISANRPDASPYEPGDYNLEFLQQAPVRELRGIDRWNLLRFVRSNWYVLAPAIVIAAIVLYGVSQLLLKRMTAERG